MKKILWVCKESFTSLANFSIPKFKDYANEAVFIHPTESLLLDKTYVNFKKNNLDIVTHVLDDVSKNYAHDFKHNTINFDYDRLEEIEKKYCKKISWGNLLMSSQIFTTPYHYRFFFKDLSDDQKNYWVFLLFEYFENLLSLNKPDYIFDFDNSEIGRSVLWLIADFLGIPYISIEHTRYKGVLIPNFCLGRKVDKYFDDFYGGILNNDSYFKDVQSFRSTDKIMNEDFKNNKTSKNKNNSFYTDLKRLFNYERTVVYKKLKKNKILGIKFNFPFIASFRSSLLFFLQLVVRERYLLSRMNSYFESPIDGEKNVYFPLHLIPESSTLIKAPTYPNEEEVILAIAKSLPLGWKLYIKEHGAMIGERPLSFYKRISRLSNVKFIKLDAYHDPKEWILKSKGVITITGTSAFEAVMLGKQAIVLGSVPFQMITGISLCNDFTDLAGLINDKFKTKGIDNIESCGNYLQAIYHFGEVVQFTLLHNLCYKALLSDDELSDIGFKEIDRIANVFRKGIEIFNEKI